MCFVKVPANTKEKSGFMYIRKDVARGVYVVLSNGVVLHWQMVLQGSNLQHVIIILYGKRMLQGSFSTGLKY